MKSANEISLRERIRLNLVSAMEAAGFSQVQLAEKLGISKGTVNNWIRGNNSPDVDMVPKICKVLNISILSLYSPTQLESTVEMQNTPSISSEALQLAQDYDKLDDHGKKIVRVVTDEEMARISAEIKNMRKQLEVAQDMIDAQKMPTPVSGDGLTKIFMCFASGLNQGQQQMVQDWLQNMTKSQQQSLLASAPQIVGKTVSKAEPPDQSQ